MLIILALAVLLVLHLLAITFFLWLSTGWIKEERVSFGAAALGTLTMVAVSAGGYFGFFQLWAAFPVNPWLALTIELLVGVALMCWALSLVFQISEWRVIVCWLATLIPTAAMVALLFFVINPFLFAAYVTAANSMAPTLRGEHQRGKCPHCGQPAMAGYSRYEVESLGPTRPGICTVCQQSGDVTIEDEKVYSADKFFVNRLLTPQRWDLVIFRPWENPDQLYVKRLVGLPGEEVIVKEGKVWINGEPQTPPPEIAELKYLEAGEKMEFAPDRRWATADRPTKLRDDEYFVLGDFSNRSMDSRYNGPITRDDLAGVVSVIYWPLDRWRILH